jgi:hypothetical protein
MKPATPPQARLAQFRERRVAVDHAGERIGGSGQKAPGVSISDASLKAVQAHSEGATPAELLNNISREFGVAVRSNYLSAALNVRRRSGQLENRDQRWYLPS